MSDLFDIEPLTPKELWWRKYDVMVYYQPSEYRPMQDWVASGSNRRGLCVGQGETADEAVEMLAQEMRVPLWNEEGGKA